MRAIFPTNFAWNPMAVCRQGRGSVRFVNSQIIGRDVRVVGQLATAQANSIGKETRNLTDGVTAVRKFIRQWIVERRVEGMNRFLVGACYVVHNWVNQTNNPNEWWTTSQRMVPVHNPPLAWGPFRIQALPRDSNAGTKWIHGLLRVLLSVIASVWMRIGERFCR
jgi:hypothetical protein